MTLDWSLWIAVALAQVTLCVMGVRAKLGCAWFPRYIYFATTKTFVLLAVAVFTRDLWIYTVVNSTAATIGPALALLVVGSLWRQTFRSPTKLPPGTLTQFRTLVLSVVFPLTVVLVTFFRSHSQHAYFNSLINLEIVVLSASGVTLALMVFYAKHLGISWRSKPAGIMAGFLWCFGTNWLVMFLAGQETMSIYAAQRIGQVAYLVALFVWFRVLLGKERSSWITDEQFDRVLHEFGLGEIYSAKLRTRQSHG